MILGSRLTRNNLYLAGVGGGGAKPPNCVERTFDYLNKTCANVRLTCLSR